MKIYFKFLSKGNYLDFVSKVMEQEFDIPQIVVKEQLHSFHQKLINRLVVVFEYPYVDKHYRDSYYFYFSTKHNEIKRDSIRLSFFSDDIEEAFFYNESKHINLQNSFLGFITLRPTRINILGRNLVSPRLFKEKEFVLIGNRLTLKQEEISGEVSRVNNLDEEVRKGFDFWVEERINYFRQLFEASLVMDVPKLDELDDAEKYICNLNRVVYKTREKFISSYVEPQNRTNDRVYNAMRNTLNSVERFFGGDGEMTRVNEITNQSYLDLADKFFPKEKTKEEINE